MDELSLAILRSMHCDRCDNDETMAEFIVMCHNGCYHPQCLECALHTDKERRQEWHQMAFLN
jgi:hypothetical protein